MAEPKELFEKKVEEIFGGSNVSGKSGFVNLVQIKQQYLKTSFTKLIEGIEQNTPSPFKGELYERLSYFISKYFDEAGNIFFVKTRSQDRITERVYKQNKDISLFWKTENLYYVKQDIIRYDSVPINEDIDGAMHTFYFDASSIKPKDSNVKQHISYDFVGKNKRTIKFKLKDASSKISSKTISEITEKLNEANLRITDQELKKIFATFEKQVSVDYFICKNAKEFLEYQFYEEFNKIIFDDKTAYTPARIKNLNHYRDAALQTIDFIAKFEDQLRKVWIKPKFVIDSDFIITFDKLEAKGSKGKDVIKKILASSGFSKQKQEWKDLATCNSWKASYVSNGVITEDYKHLAIDTKHFPDTIKYEILALFDDLDAELDGWIVNSDNFQALNTLKHKFKGKIQCTYIDPPFNVPGTSKTVYINDFDNAPWLSLVENRISVGRELLDPKNGIFIAAIDKQMQESFGLLLQQIFPGYDHDCVTVINNPAGVQQKIGLTEGFSYNHEFTYFFYPEKLKWANETPLTNYDDMLSNSLAKWGNDSDRSTGVNSFYPIIIDLKNFYDPKVTFGDALPLKKHPKLIDPEGNCTLESNGIFAVWPIDTSSKEKKWRQSKDYIETSLQLLQQQPETLGALEHSPDDARDRNDHLLNSDPRGNRLVKWKNYRFRPYDKDGKFTDDVSKITRIGIEEIRWYGKFKTVWKDPRYNADTGGSRLLTNMFTQEKNTFDNPKSVFAVKDCLYSVLKDDTTGYVLDYFGGSGTTCHATMLLNKEDEKDGKSTGKRKFILVEQGEYFDTIVLPRVKKAAFSVYVDGWKTLKKTDKKPEPIAGKDGIGLFVKYYKLEQYEQVLAESVYTKKDPPKFSSPEDYGKYIFMDDPNLLLNSLDFDFKNNTHKIDWKKIYPDHKIDLAETLSCARGEMIKKQEAEKVSFASGTIDYKKIAFDDVKNLLWWYDI